MFSSFFQKTKTCVANISFGCLSQLRHVLQFKLWGITFYIVSNLINSGGYQIDNHRGRKKVCQSRHSSPDRQGFTTFGVTVENMNVHKSQK